MVILYKYYFDRLRLLTSSDMEKNPEPRAARRSRCVVYTKIQSLHKNSSDLCLAARGGDLLRRLCTVELHMTLNLHRVVTRWLHTLMKGFFIWCQQIFIILLRFDLARQLEPQIIVSFFKCYVGATYSSLDVQAGGVFKELCRLGAGLKRCKEAKLE